MNTCYLCGIQTDALCRHSFDDLMGKPHEIENCEDSATCYKRCHENAQKLEEQAKMVQALMEFDDGEED